jgi:mono/diheme cytochrome c family protein
MIFAQNCASCHGDTGAGDGALVGSGQITNVPDFTDERTTQEQSPQAWFDVITDGRLEALMPPWRNALSAADRWAVAFYAYTLSYDAAMVAEGERLYHVTCAACHGQVGEGGADAPPLIGLVDFAEADLLRLLDTHLADVDDGPLPPDYDSAAVLQYLRLLSTTTRALPGEVGPLVQPSVTEEIAAQPSPIISPEVGMVHGRVLQGTEGGPSLAGLEAALRIFQREGDEQVMRTIVSDDGRYQFDDVVIRTDAAYVVTVDSRDGVRFFSGIYTAAPGTTDVTLDVMIYETTADPAVIEIDSRAFQMNLTPHGIYVIEVLNLTNTSDQYVYARNHDEFGVVSVSFPIAESAQLEPGHTDLERLLLSGNGRELFDKQPVLPGREHYVQFSYLLPVTSNTVIPLLPSGYKQGGVTEFYVDFNHLTLQGDGITFSRNENFDGDVYRVYTVTDAVQAGQVASLQVVSVERGIIREDANPGLMLAGLLIFSGVGLLIGALIFYLSQRWRIRVEDDLTSDDLIAQIVQLDNRFREGEIDTTTYDKQRSSLKKKLARKMKQDGSVRARD